jgi:hypothetical protein
MYEFPLLWAQAARAEDMISPTASMINAGNLKDKMKIKKKLNVFSSRISIHRGGI